MQGISRKGKEVLEKEYAAPLWIVWQILRSKSKSVSFQGSSLNLNYLIIYIFLKSTTNSASSRKGKKDYKVDRH